MAGLRGVQAHDTSGEDPADLGKPRIGWHAFRA
jgi:hypothetical protein